MTGDPRLIWDLQAELGEGPVWDGLDCALWFTDIKRRKIHRYDPANGATKTWDSPGQVGFIVPARSGAFVAGLSDGLYRFDPASGRFELIVEVEPDRPGNRLNDGVVDPAGRLWFGTMDDGERSRTGAFHCFHEGELRPTGITGIRITNGPAVSPDGTTLYWVDTLGGTVSECAILDDGTLGPSRLLVRIDRKEGYPDGPTVDCEGCIWIALYAGWEARRYSPSGELLEAVRFPAANITKLAFGGEGLRTAFATTARQMLDADALARQPHAGGLFEFSADVPGLASPAVADR